NGQEALAAAEKERFDVILLDVQMPEMDGPEAATWLRQRPGINQKTPIVAVTAHVAPRDRESFLKSGMDDILIKPIQRQELQRVRAGLWGSTPGVPSEKEPPVAPTAGGLDLHAILARLEGDRSLLHDLIAVFHRDWPRWAAELSVAIERADWPQVAF